MYTRNETNMDSFQIPSPDSFSSSKIIRDLKAYFYVKKIQLASLISNSILFNTYAQDTRISSQPLVTMSLSRCTPRKISFDMPVN
jgi:hypothetical protein